MSKPALQSAGGHANSPAPAAAAPPPAANDLFVARQPIFDGRREVAGYELLFRNSQDNRYQFDDSSQATRFTVNTSVNVVGLHQLVGEQTAWINLTRDLLIEDFYLVLPAHHVVVELLEDIEPDDEVIEACRRLKAAGYQLALDDFVFEGKIDYTPLIELADVVKVDLLQNDVQASAAHLQAHARPGLQFLAEKVEDHEQFEAARHAGYELFQGFFFCKPEMMQEQDLSACKQNYLLLLQEVTKDKLDYEQVESRIKLEPSLSVKLLRYINSASLGVRHQVLSIRQALALLGEKAMRQWGALVAMTCLGEDKPAELLRTCLQRARFCEQLGPHLGGDEAKVDHFLLGLLSVLDAAMDRPLSEILPSLPISQTLRSALLGDNSKLAKLYMLCRACERGAWPQARMVAQMLEISPGQISIAHQESLTWADRILAASFETQTQQK